MANFNDDRRTHMSGNSDIPVRRGVNWLAWLLLAAGVIALIVFLTRRTDIENDGVQASLDTDTQVALIVDAPLDVA